MSNNQAWAIIQGWGIEMSLNSGNSHLQNRIEELEAETKILGQRIEKFVRILSSLDTGLSIISPDMKIEWVNDKIRQMFPNNDPIGQTCHVCYEASDTPCALCPTINCFKTGNICSEERFNSSNQRWYHIISQPIKDENGTVNKVLEGVTDISERKRAEVKLKESEKKFRETIQCLDEGYYSVTIDGLLIDHNQAFCRVLGFDTDHDLKGKKSPDFWRNPEDRDKYRNELMQNGIVRNYPVNAKNINDDDIFVLLNAHIVKDQEGQSIRIEGTVTDITEIKLAEQALHENEQKYRTVVDSVGEGIILQEASGKILSWNKSAEDVFGISKEQAIGQTSINTDWPTIHEDGSKFEGKDHPSMITLNTGNPCNNVIMGVGQSDKSVKWIKINTKPIFTESSKNPSAVVISFSNITQFKQIENDLRRSKQELQRTLDATADGIWSWKFKTNELYFSPKYYKMLGYVPNEFPANFENWLNLIHPDDRERALDVANKFLKTKPDLYENEFRLRTKNGDYRWARTVAKVVERDENGDAVYMIGNHEDITERKLALDALIEERERFELAMRSVNDGLWDWNLKTNEIYYSPVWKKLLGYEDHEIENKFSEWERLTDPKDVKASWTILNEVLEGKRKSFENEFKMLHKDGHWVDILARANVILDINGEGARVIGTHVDITERKRLEKQLQQSQKMEAIGTLAGGIAHDFNNMLGIITGNISYALSHLNKDDELYEVLTDVQESSKQAQGLTHQLLTFSKGGAPIKKIADINKIISDAAVFSIRGAKSKCRFELSDDLWHSEVDEGQITQVVNNLVINANQAMPNGGTIDVRTENVNIENKSGIPLPAGRYIKIAVEDQGVGISKNHLSNIFEPYFTTKQKGSGLGLATAYSIINKHDGHIAVYSEIEKGTVFNIYLPASIRDSMEYKDQAETKHKGQGKILIMDDQEAILKMVDRMLTRMGYETTFAIDGSEAIKKYHEAYHGKNPFDLVILDLTIPGGMGGTKTIIELLKIDPNAKALVSSGYSNDPIMANYEDYGFCGVVPKPYTKEQLSKVLNKIFGKKV